MTTQTAQTNPDTDTIARAIRNATIICLQQQIYTVLASRASNGIYGFNKRENSNGKHLAHMCKVKEMWRLWDMCKSTIPNRYHARYERLMRSSDARDLSVALGLALHGRWRKGWGK